MAVETADDLSAYFNEADFAVPASYTPAGGSPTPITVIFGQAVERGGLGNIGNRTTASTAMVRATEVALPRNGDSVVILGTTYKVRGADRDAIGAIWTLDLDKQ